MVTGVRPRSKIAATTSRGASQAAASAARRGRRLEIAVLVSAGLGVVAWLMIGAAPTSDPADEAVSAPALRLPEGDTAGPTDGDVRWADGSALRDSEVAADVAEPESSGEPKAAHPAHPAGRDCDPAFSVDEQGVKTLKPGCG